MNAEIISVGTEILLGEIINTSAPYIAQRLANLGIDVYFQETVGDNDKRLTDSIDLATSRSNLVVISGGLGPTEDDITKQVLAKVLGKKLVTDKKALAKINHFYQSYSLKKPKNADVMAQYIEGAEVLPNDKGFAVGMFLTTKDCDYMVLPGPPVEMSAMFSNYGLPILAKLATGANVIESKVMRFFGIGETELEADLKPLIDHQTNPTLATYAKRNEVTLRITASGQNKEEVNSLIDNMIDKVMAIDGKYFYGYGFDNSLENVVAHQLFKQNYSITAAESLTAGMFQSTLGNISGISQVYSGGFVTYSAKIKEQLVDVPKDVIEKYGVVSKETAEWMCKNSKNILKTDIGVSFTGVAGPDSLEGHPAGDFFVGLALPNGDVVTKEFHYAKSRNEIRDYATKCALKMIYDRLK